MLLDVRGLSKEFVRRGKPFLAVDSVDLQLERGDFIALTGRSGSGKTTLMTLLAGLARPTAGSMVFDGRANLAALSDAETAALRGCGIAYVPQGQSLLGNLTVMDNIRLPCYLSGDGEDIPGRAEYLLDEVGIADLADAYPSQLSGGEMRRAALARALMTRPRLLLADEPTGDLDGANTEIVMRLLEKTAGQGAAVLFSTHERDALQRVECVLEMHEGRLDKRMEAVA